jgi:membrane protein DedA with SNARE-associated domain/rhodanese-related sulfurtransferase
MAPGSLSHLLESYGLALVFGNVLVEQSGLPIPAVPTMIAAGALAAEGQYPPLAVMAAAFAACIIGDSAWYVVGRLYGHRVMKLLCGISLSPDSCVRQTSLQFERWGGWTLVLGKFLPGIGTVAPPLAAVMRMGWTRFLLLSGLGSALWVGLAVGAGMLFHARVNEVLARLEELGGTALIALGALVAGYIALKWWQRRRFYRTLRMARITVAELRGLMDRKEEPVVVDLRAASDRLSNGHSIPGALAIDLAQVERHLRQFPKDREIIFFCNCPNEASAASAAKVLMDLGYTRVRPLLGGLEAWAAAGYAVEAGVIATKAAE